MTYWRHEYSSQCTLIIRDTNISLLNRNNCTYNFNCWSYKKLFQTVNIGFILKRFKTLNTTSAAKRYLTYTALFKINQINPANCSLTGYAFLNMWGMEEARSWAQNFHNRVALFTGKMVTINVWKHHFI